MPALKLFQNLNLAGEPIAIFTTPFLALMAALEYLKAFHLTLDILIISSKTFNLHSVSTFLYQFFYLFITWLNLFLAFMTKLFEGMLTLKRSNEWFCAFKLFVACWVLIRYFKRMTYIGATMPTVKS